MRITTIINQKGGVGKTTTTHALASGLKMKGYIVLCVDMDPQGNLSYTMNADTSGAGLYDAMKGDVDVIDVIQKTDHGDIIPSTILLTAADMEFTATGREWIIDGIINKVKNIYSHIIIDCPPSLGILTINALTSCTDVIIPMGADIYSLQGLYQLHDTILKVKKYCNKEIVIAGLLLTRYNSRSILSRDLRNGIESKANEINAFLYKTTIREGVAIKEAQTNQTSIFDYSISSNPSLDYMNFIDEYLYQEKT